MSAPEPQVRVDGYWYECDGCGVRRYVWSAEVYPEKAGMAADAHAETCEPLKLARLQARWDARDEALRGLVEKWRAKVATACPCDDCAHWTRAATELERAIGGGE